MLDSFLQMNPIPNFIKIPLDSPVVGIKLDTNITLTLPIHDMLSVETNLLYFITTYGWR